MLFSRQATSLNKTKLSNAFTKSRFSNTNISDNNGNGLDEYQIRHKQTVLSQDPNSRLESLGDGLNSGRNIQMKKNMTVDACKAETKLPVIRG